jgi:hypothetical protein
MIITLDIDKSSISEIENIYDNGKYNTVETVVYDIIERYLHAEYFYPDLKIEDNGNDGLDCFILNKMKVSIQEIIVNNGYDNLLFNATLFSEALDKENFVIPEYTISRIYALSEIYYELTNKPTCYSEIIELIVSYDIRKNK